MAYSYDNGYETTRLAQNGQKSEALSVSAAMSMAKASLEHIVVRIIGEVSEFSHKSGYKAVYFTIKDTQASLPCMMWNNRYQASGVELRVGVEVELTGRFTLYAAKGRMNFDVMSISLAGEGALRMQVAQRAQKLQAEGLMNPRRKRAIPAYPETIGLVTSPRGAAVRDVLRTLRRRYPLARIVLAGVPVEGSMAPKYLCDGLREVVSGGAEVVLLVRGGGSYEDLMPFNDESLARMVAACPVPVVTGIGHEPDNSIVDMVADVRASTPTAAAEAVSPDTQAIKATIEHKQQRIYHSIKSSYERLRLRVERIALLPIFKEPTRLLEREMVELDDLSARLATVLPTTIQNDRHRLELLRANLIRILAQGVVRHKQTYEMTKQVFAPLGKRCIEQKRRDMALQAARLNDLSPLSVLSRGFSLVRNDMGAIVHSIDDVAIDKPLEVSVADGVIECEVRGTKRITTTIEPWEVIDE